MSPFGKLPGFRQDQTEGSSINTLIILISNMCYDYKNAAITGHFSRVTVQSEFLRQNKTN